MRFFYDAVHLLLAIVHLPAAVYRLLTGRRTVEALWRRAIGSAPRLAEGRDVVWFHAVSIGEVLLLRPLIDRLRDRKPHVRIVISVETPGGYQAAAKAYPHTPLFFVPLDFSWCVRRVYRALSPRLVVLSELELWPNLLLEAKRRGIPVAVVSSRMNDADYRFFLRINRLHRPALAAIHWWGVQSDRDAERIRRLVGTGPAAVVATGSLKFDSAPDGQTVSEAGNLLRRLGFNRQEKILLAGSTHPPEEELLLDAFLKLSQSHPELRLILAPRAAWRFARVAGLLARRGVSFARRSRLAAPLDRPAPVTLLDSHGELPALWPHADIAFVGGTLAKGRGGQNVLEPAAAGKPVCFGPHVWNFSDAAAGLLRAGGAQEVLSCEDIVTTVGGWLENPQEALRTGAKARSFVASRWGATAVTLSALLDLLAPEAGQGIGSTARPALKIAEAVE